MSGIDVPATPAWRVQAKISARASHFMTTAELVAQSWMRALPAALPAAPASLSALLRATLGARCGVPALDRAAALDALLHEDAVAPPHEWGRVMSGSRDTALLFDPSTECAAFVAHLFSSIVQHAPAVGTTIELSASDLYHAHCFSTAWRAPRDGGSGGSDAVAAIDDATHGRAELGLLFHAKEFPREYRLSRFGSTHPIGAEEMGGADDPRIGTKTSTADPDYALRNFVWLLSTNTLYVVDIREPSFGVAEVAPSADRAAPVATPFATPSETPIASPRDASRPPRPAPASQLMNKEFATVDLRFFCGLALFDVNFFTAAAAGGGGGANRFVGVPLVCPCGGIDPTLQLRALFRAAPPPSLLEGPERARVHNAAAAVVHRLTSARSAVLRAALSGDGAVGTACAEAATSGAGGAFGVIVRRRLPAAWWSHVLGIMSAQEDAERVALAAHNDEEHAKLVAALYAVLAADARVDDEERAALRAGTDAAWADVVEQALRLSAAENGSRSAYRAEMLVAVLHPVLRSAPLRALFAPSLRCVDAALAPCPAPRRAPCAVETPAAAFTLADARVATEAAFYDSSVLEVLQTALAEQRDCASDGATHALDPEELRRIAADVVERKTQETNARWEAAQRARAAAAAAEEEEDEDEGAAGGAAGGTVRALL